MKKSKKIGIIFLSILIASSIFCATQWNRWFFNPAESPYTTPSLPDRITLSYGQDAPHTRIISWRCDSVVKPVTFYCIQKEKSDTLRKSVQGTIIASRSGKSAFYKITLENLAENAIYNYRIAQETDTTEWYQFSTEMPQNNLDFIIYGDIHNPTEDLHNFFATVNQKHPDTQFWGFVGDMIERPTDAYWTGLYNCLNDIPQHKPMVACTGNHEYLKGVIKKIDPRWIHTFGNPMNAPQKQVGRTYYIDFPYLRYIVLDTDGMQLPCDYISTRRWLKLHLQTNPKQWVMVVMHHPVHSACEGRNNPLIRMTFDALFRKYKVDMVIQGHDHSYARNTTKNNGKSTTPVYIVLNSSDKNYQGKKLKDIDLTAEGERYYTHFSITHDTLQMSTFRLTEQQPFDQIIIKK